MTVLPTRLLASSAPRDNRALLRVACNRDELLTRAHALPPTTWTSGSHSVMMPIDPQSGGTWIAANDTGLVFVILNVNPGGPVLAAEMSRGTIIPVLVSSGTISEALDRVLHLPAERYRPFRLLLIEQHQIVECWPENRAMRHRRAFLHGAVMRTSSGLGDAIVVGPRRTLFRQLFRDPGDLRNVQDRFHQHQWPGREAVSVRMSREDARTVSHTVVEVTENLVSLAYHPVDSVDSASAHLERSAVPGRATELRQLARAWSS